MNLTGENLLELPSENKLYQSAKELYTTII